VLDFGGFHGRQDRPFSAYIMMCIVLFQHLRGNAKQFTYLFKAETHIKEDGGDAVSRDVIQLDRILNVEPLSDGPPQSSRRILAVCPAMHRDVSS